MSQYEAHDKVRALLAERAKDDAVLTLVLGYLDGLHDELRAARATELRMRNALNVLHERKLRQPP